jgi:serine protease Do
MNPEVVVKRAVPLILALMFAVSVPTARGQSTLPRKDIPAIAKASNGAIVTIVTAVNDKPLALSTGFLVSADGVIVTNYHVIKTGNVAAVKFPDGSVFAVDGLLASDKDRDVAVIKIHGKASRTLTLGNSDRVQVGEAVVAIGNPLGLELTVSNGILSGVRTVEKEGGRLQVTAPISHGSSGGPLFNMAGQVIGINSMYLEGGENLNFAIPINDAKSLLRKRRLGKPAPSLTLTSSDHTSADAEELWQDGNS